MNKNQEYNSVVILFVVLFLRFVNLFVVLNLQQQIGRLGLISQLKNENMVIVTSEWVDRSLKIGKFIPLENRDIVNL